MSFWLSWIVNQPILEINITLFGAYLLFYAAESILKVSGILAMVALGLYMTKTGKTKISSVSEHAVHHVWSFVGFCAETMIFLLTGNIIAIQVFKEDTIIGFDDWWKLLCLYFMLNMLWFFLVFVFSWIISKIGYNLDSKQLTILSFGGLRGAVGLSLALIVKLDPLINSEV